MGNPSKKIAKIAKIAGIAKIEDERNLAAHIAEAEEWNKRRLALLKIARQELPGVDSRTVKSRPGTAEWSGISRPCRDCLFLLAYPAVPAGLFSDAPTGARPWPLRAMT
jgi:hypothetical protein